MNSVENVYSCSGQNNISVILIKSNYTTCSVYPDLL